MPVPLLRHGRACPPSSVMAGLVLPPPSWPGLSSLLRHGRACPGHPRLPLSPPPRKQDVDARHKAGHDEGTEVGHGERAEAGHGEGMEAGHDERVEGMTKGGQVMAVAMSRMRAATAVTLSPPSWPGLSRPSTSSLAAARRKQDVDARHKAGHDEGTEVGHGERAEAGHDEGVEAGHPVFTGMAAKAAMPWLDHPPSRVMTFAEGHACERGAR